MRTSPKTLGIISVIAVIGVPIVILSLLLLVTYSQNRAAKDSAEFGTFASCEDIAAVISRRASRVIPPYYAEDKQNSGSGSTPSTPSATDFSPTNVQVAGIDEADIWKTDGKYIYVAAGKIVYIVPADKNVSNVIAEVKQETTISGIYISGQKLVVISGGYGNYPLPAAAGTDKSLELPVASSSTVKVNIYNLAEIKSPKLIESIDFDGSYNTSRLQNGKLFIVGNMYSSGLYSNVTADQVESSIPKIAISSGSQATAQDGVKMVECNQVSHYGESYNNWVTLVGVDLDSPSDVTSKVILGDAQTIYMSSNNLYLTSVSYSGYTYTPTPEVCQWFPWLSGCQVDTQTVSSSDYKPETNIFRLAIEGSTASFAASGKVEGTLLNQFAMDELSGYLRVATNTLSKSNNLYILDENMQRVGSLEGLAPDESLYAVRYIGERAYLITFQTIDPLIVLDLSIPANPKVLGELEMPGFSTYLHPYDATHLIGVGRDTTDIGGGRTVTNGLKVALYDVSNPQSPTVIDQVVLKSVSADSEALRDHKAFLFDKEKNLLVIPVQLNTQDYKSLFTGFYAWQVNLKGFKELAKIKTQDNSNTYYYYGYQNNKRAMYVGEDLFLWDGIYLQVWNMANWQKLSMTSFGSN